MALPEVVTSTARLGPKRSTPLPPASIAPFKTYPCAPAVDMPTTILLRPPIAESPGCDGSERLHAHPKRNAERRFDFGQLARPEHPTPTSDDASRSDGVQVVCGKHAIVIEAFIWPEWHFGPSAMHMARNQGNDYALASRDGRVA